MTRLPICLEEMQKPRHLKQMARAIVQPPQLQYGFALMGDPECFDQRRNPGAVDIGQLRHIDRERRQRRPPECRKQLVSEFWRRVNRHAATQANECSFLTVGHAHAQIGCRGAIGGRHGIAPPPCTHRQVSFDFDNARQAPIVCPSKHSGPRHTATRSFREFANLVIAEVGLGRNPPRTAVGREVPPLGGTGEGWLAGLRWGKMKLLKFQKNSQSIADLSCRSGALSCPSRTIFPLQCTCQEVSPSKHSGPRHTRPQTFREFVNIVKLGFELEGR